MMSDIRLRDVIAPSFYDVHRDVKADGHTHYFLKGGRGSTKSSFVSLEIIADMMRDGAGCHAIAFRKIAKDLKDSVFNQLIWAIDELGVNRYWAVGISPLKLTYRPTGQMIYFRGMDDASKSKSIKVPNGYFKHIWVEEADQFAGMPEIRKFLQSILRGGSDQKVFYTYNPPQSVNSWINAETLIERDDRIIHHSTYQDVPRDWLGDTFLREAEALRRVDETAYNHEYLGEVTGTGGEIFKNVRFETITDDDIQALGRVYRGLDFGFTNDPCAYICCALHNKRLYIFHEVYNTEMGFDNLYAAIAAENKNNDLVYADSAEPRSIHELSIRGLAISAARKYPGSVDHGITRLRHDLTDIIIDPVRCPNAAREFSTYEYERDRDGNFKAAFPDKNNHTIDAVRYALCNTELMTRPDDSKPPRHHDFDLENSSRSVIGGNPNIFIKR